MQFDPELERRLAEEMRSLPVPEGLEERVVAMAREKVATQAPARRPRRRRLFSLVATGVFLAGAGSAGAYWFLANDDGNAIPAGPDARAAISESEILASAPWIKQPGASGSRIQDVAPTRSLEYPPGTSYAAAVDRLVRSVVETGLLPSGTTLSEPLPGQVVWARGQAGAGPRLDLRAPLGYNIPSGIIRTPSFALSPNLTPEQIAEAARALINRRVTGKPLGPGIRIDTPALAPCQIQSPGELNAPCRLAPARAGK